MHKFINSVPKFKISSLLDYFIPPEIQVNLEAHRRARMFMLSHVFGPILGNSIPAYLYVTGISRDYHVGVFAALILSFWIYPWLLKWTGRYLLLAFVSIQNLIFAVLWACFSYGGLASPFVPWMLIFPLLAFLYLPPRGWVRNALLIQMFGSVASFVAYILLDGTLPASDMADFQIIGMISMASVALYFGMMSLYFAKMFREQHEFTKEFNALVSTSDNVRHLTQVANQAGAAKASFIASMSHELRTPLNAIIGYSQLLLEESREDGDEDVVVDVGHIHEAGTTLLHLIDNILDYSKIEAGKMPVNPALGSISDHLEKWLREMETSAAAGSMALSVRADSVSSGDFRTDWTVVGASLKHLVRSFLLSPEHGRIEVGFVVDETQMILDVGATRDNGEPIPAQTMKDMFEDSGDLSSSKYGSTGIEVALSNKFARLIGGTIEIGTRGSQFINLIRLPSLAHDFPASGDAKRAA